MSAVDYARLFRVWPMRADKTPLASGFGADRPHATWDPRRIKDGAPVGILCGPLQPGLADDWHVLGLDLDKAMTREKLEDVLGPLPETLTSKGWRHAYYLIPADHPLHQRNGAITCEGGALDIRPCAGGYMIEKGDWDGGFDPSRIVPLPAPTLEKLATIIGEKRKRDGSPAVAGPVQIADRDRDIARLLGALWQPNTTGDRAFGGLGGWLARRGVSRDRAETIAGLIAETASSRHPDPLARVAQGYDGDCPLGRPTLQSALEQGADAGAVQLTLDEIEELLAASVPGFVPAPEERPEQGKLHGLRVLSGDALRVDIPETRWLCRDLQFAPGRPPVIAAAESAGKSWSLQCIAMSVALGRPIFNRFAVQTPGPVIHVCSDAGENATLRKYQQIAKAMHVSVPDNLYVVPDRLTGAVDRFGTFKPDSLKGLKALAGDLDARLIILDSMFAICAGVDMASPDAGAPLYHTKDEARVWLWAMHIPKSGGDYFGSAAIGAAAGVLWGIEKTEREDKARLWALRKRSEDAGRVVEDFYTNWDRVETDDGDVLEGQILYADAQPAETAPSPADARQAVREAMIAALTKYEAAGLSQGQLAALGPKMRRVDKLDVLSSLVDSGAAVRSKAGKSWIYHPGARVPEHVLGTRSRGPEHEGLGT